MEKKRDRRIFTCIASVILLGFSSPLLWVALTTRYPRAVRDPFKPLYFPAGVLTFILIACTVLLCYNLYRIIRERQERTRKGESIGNFKFITNKALITFIVTVVYALTWRVAGFSVSTAVFMALISKKLEPERPWRQTIVVSVAAAAVIYILFTFVFKVPFPEPLLDPILDRLLY